MTNCFSFSCIYLSDLLSGDAVYVLQKLRKHVSFAFRRFKGNVLSKEMYVCVVAAAEALSFHTYRVLRAVCYDRYIESTLLLIC